MKYFMWPEDIKNGKPSECSDCPIALCILRSFPLWTVRVGAETILIYKDKKKMKTEMPIECRRFINDFDLGNKKMSPIEFELEWKSFTIV